MSGRSRGEAPMEIGKNIAVNHPQFDSLTILREVSEGEYQVRCHGGEMNDYLAMIQRETLSKIMAAPKESSHTTQ